MRGIPRGCTRAAAVGSIAALALAGSAFVGGVTQAGAASCTPSTTADDGSATSLRGLLENLSTNSCGPVVLASGVTYDLTIDADGEIDIDGPVVIEGNGSTIRQTDGDDNVLETDFDLTLRNVTVTGGRAGFGDGGGIQNNDSGATLRIEGSVITHNSAIDGDGGGIFSGGPLVLVNSTVSNNAADQDGGGIANEALLTITASTISGNCAQDDSGAIDGDDDTVIVNSTVTENVSDDDGAIGMDTGNLTLVYSDLVRNTLTDEVTCPEIVAGALGDPDDPEAAEVSATDGDVEAQDEDEASNLFMNNNTLSAFASVIALPLVGDGEDPFTVPPFNCSSIDPSGNPTQSSGYNFSDDATCNFSNTATGDRENAGDPGLGALAGNGGPTQTLLPSSSSPLLNFVPIAACGGGDALAGFAVTTDQRGILRPQSTGCEVGSVEIVLEVVVDFAG